jgi:hypothetical protein
MTTKVKNIEQNFNRIAGAEGVMNLAPGQPRRGRLLAASSPSGLYLKLSKHTIMEPITMRKKGSPHLVKITSDPADAHFCDVRLIRLKDNSVRGKHYILASDVQTWVAMYRRDGFNPMEGGSHE